MPTYLGIDLGTSGVRGVLIDDGLQIVAHAALPYPGPLTEATVWLEGIEQLAATLIRQSPAGWRALTAISIDGTSATLLPCDTRGAPLGPALLYFDQRAQEEATWLAREWPAGDAALGAASSLSKLLWLRRHDPHYPRLRYIHHQADWVAAQLTGLFGQADRGNLLKLGLDGARLSYPPALLGLLKIADVNPALLPHALREGENYGTVRPDWARRLQIPAHTVVRAGCTDSVAAAIAAGLHSPGQALSSLGSTLAIKVVHTRPYAGKGLYSHYLGRHTLVGAASNSGGAALLRHFSRPQMVALSAALKPATPSGQLLYPLPTTGERYPLNAPQWPGSSIPPLAAEVRFQALLEGLSYIEAWCYATLEEQQIAIVGAIRSTGGGTANLPWMQMRANILDKPVQVIAHGDPALGSALLAASTDLGELETLQTRQPAAEQVFLPETTATSQYREYYHQFREHFEALSTPFFSTEI
ncbi:MAG: FGGY-family carbohydrate kinase [Acidithiobacillus sp.]